MEKIHQLQFFFYDKSIALLEDTLNPVVYTYYYQHNEKIVLHLSVFLLSCVEIHWVTNLALSKLNQNSIRIIKKRNSKHFIDDSYCLVINNDKAS